MAIKKVADIPEDYSQKIKPFEWVLIAVSILLLIAFIVGLFS